jgi:hypothetical protein
MHRILKQRLFTPAISFWLAINASEKFRERDEARNLKSK